MKGDNMEDKNKVKDMVPEKKVEEVEEEVRELPDKELENIAGGTIPVIDAF
jgi:hypothetical protein